jgi:hypothetical protein
LYASAAACPPRPEGGITRRAARLVRLHGAWNGGWSFDPLAAHFGILTHARELAALLADLA